jgi:phosphatidylserine decarboxylase
MRNTALTDWLKSWPLVVLPHHLLSGIVRAAARWQTAWWKNLLINSFIRQFRVDMTEAQDPDPGHYPDFNSFFTRALNSAARPLADQPQAIVSPVDGRISQIGSISDGRLLQAKGQDYSLVTLLGGSEERARTFHGGSFATLYLSPRDYHRIHMPCTGQLTESIYIPGRQFSVAPAGVRTIPGLFSRNERLATLFDTPSGPMALVMVGAIFVACMETVWDGVVRPTGPGIQERQYHTGPGSGIELRQGDEMGRFNMGSTVILLYGPGRVRWLEGLAAEQPLRMGEIIGYFQSDP